MMAPEYLQSLIDKNIRVEMIPGDKNILDSTLNILLVEDNPGDVYIIKDILKSAPVNCSIVNTPYLKTAIQLLTEKSFDAVLLDLGLPDSVGIETIKKIKAPDQKVPIIVLTGLDNGEIAIDALKEGAQDYLVKGTLNLDKIIHSIRYGIERKKIEVIQKRSATQFSILSYAATAINESEEPASIYRLLCANIKNLVDYCYVIAVEISENGTAHVVDYEGLDPFVEQFRFFTGDKLLQKKFNLKQIPQEYLTKTEKFIEVDGNLSTLLKNIYSPEIGHELDNLLGLEKVYGLYFLDNDIIIGAVLLLAKSEVNSDDQKIIESICNQASLNLKRKIVERELRKSEEQYRKLNEQLEIKVYERTEELAIVNNSLSNELRERVKMEEALRDSEERYRSLIESSPDGVIVSQNNRFLFANSVALKLYKAENLNQLQDKMLLDLFHPDDRFIMEARMQQGFSSKTIPLQEAKIIGLNGQITPVECIGSKILYNGKSSFQIILRDITERKTREKELDKLNRILKAHNNISHAMLHSKDESTFLDEICKIIVKDCGHAMIWIGYAQDDKEKTVKPVAYAGFEKGYLEKLRVNWGDNERGSGPTGTAIRTGKYCECRNMLTDSKFSPWRDEAIRRGYASSIAFPLTEGSKTFGSITIYSKEPNAFTDDEKSLLFDLTLDVSYGISTLRAQHAKALAEKELTKTKNYLESLIDYANAPILVWNPDSEIQLFNKALEFVTGYSSEEVIGKKIDFLFPKDNLLNTKEKIEKFLLENNWKSVEIPILCKDGDIRIILWNFANIYDFDNKTVVSIIAQGNDITEKKKDEERLAKYASDLKELNATKDKFFSIIAHDLKNPFSSILAASELLSSNIDELDKDNVLRYSKILNDAAKSAYLLLENLLEWSRTQTGTLEFYPQKIDIGEIISRNISHVAVPAANKDIQLLSKVTSDIQAVADKNMLNTVIRNLLSNAVKFTRKGGKVMIDAKPDKNFITFTVKDNGVGIPKKDIDKLFRIDVKFTNPGTANEKGTGLGLLLCKEFIEKHGGHIWVESVEGKGSEFKFTIPKNIKIENGEKKEEMDMKKL